MAGWIKLYRDIQEHWIWKSDHRLKWWLDILLTVNHSDSKVLIGGNLIECKRGQSVMSLESWGKRWGVTKKAVRNFFILLQNDSMLLLENLKITTRITVCNYDNYQSEVNGQETDRKRKRNGQETDSAHKQEGKEVIKNEKKYGNIPPTFEEVKLRFKERQLKNFSPEKFHAHYTANGWMVGKNKMKNWDSALTTWEFSKDNTNATIKQSNTRSVKRVNDYWNRPI